MGRAPLGGAGRVVGGRAQQRMAELEVAVGDRHQPSGLGCLEILDRQPELAQGRLDHPDQAAVRAGGDQQRAALVVAEVVERAPERPLDAGARSQRLLERFTAGPLAVGQQARDLQQRERIAGGGLHQPLGDGGCEPVGLRRGQQLTRLLVGQRLDRQQLQPRDLERGHRRAVAHGPDHRDAFGAEPAAGEQERLQRRLVEPLRVVDRNQDRLLLGRHREQAEQAGRDREPVVRRRRPERERPPQRARLHLRDVVEAVEQGCDQLGQAGERDVGLGLDPPRPQHPQPRRLADRPAHQRGLADAGLAVHQQRPALAGTGLLQQAVDPCPFAFASYEHRRSLSPRTGATCATCVASSLCGRPPGRAAACARA